MVCLYQSRRYHFWRNRPGKLGKIILELLHQGGCLVVIRLRVIPGLARVQDMGRHARTILRLAEADARSRGLGLWVP